MTLAADEMYSIPGDLLTRIAGNRRKLDSFRQTVKDGKIAILRTPAVHLLDATSDRVRTLALSGGSLALADPCWTISAVYSSDGEFTPAAP